MKIQHSLPSIHWPHVHLPSLSQLGIFQIIEITKCFATWVMFGMAGYMMYYIGFNVFIDALQSCITHL